MKPSPALAAFFLLLSSALCPASDQSREIRHIVFGSCLDTPDHPMLDRTLTLPMDLFIFMGDNIYADTEDMALMRSKYEALRGGRFFQALESKAPILATWDDHDFGVNDGGADYPMKRESQREFLRWLRVPEDSPLHRQEGVYDARIFGPEGRRTQIILLDTRYFRSPLKKVPKAEAGLGGTSAPNEDPAATLLGAAQWQWLREQLLAPAELRIIVSSIQFAASASGQETWSNFPQEQRRMADLIRETGANGVIFLSGDRHWSEFSAYGEGAAYPLQDFTSSSMTQNHPRGTPTPNTRRTVPATWHQVNAGTLEIDWTLPNPRLTVRIVDVAGGTRLEKSLVLSELRP